MKPEIITTGTLHPHASQLKHTGIRNAVLNQFELKEDRSDIGALFENYVIAESMKRKLQAASFSELYFWRAYAGEEVDLVIKTADQLQAYEIKWQRNRRSKTAFENEYQIPVQTLTADHPSLWWEPPLK